MSGRASSFDHGHVFCERAGADFKRGYHASSPQPHGKYRGNCYGYKRNSECNDTSCCHAAAADGTVSARTARHAAGSSSHSASGPFAGCRCNGSAVDQVPWVSLSRCMDTSCPRQDYSRGILRDSPTRTGDGFSFVNKVGKA
eukprot:356177-Chlamydomonas_euryale.AAC.3